ncbi:MAG: hypothetical protein FD167_4698 [bacterium]|nr:MAG: hypothetical protein FD167_4698 [bacterium]
MTKKLLLFIVCVSVFSCGQNTPPQPQMTILSLPTASPTPEINPSTTTKENLVAEINDNLTPKDTMQAFCQADFNGVRTSLDTYQEVIPYVTWDVAVEADAHIVSDFKIVNSMQTEEDANVAVVYTKVGKLFEGKIEDIGATSDIVTYKLVKEAGRWKIYYPQPPAYISLNAAKKLVKK